MSEPITDGDVLWANPADTVRVTVHADTEPTPPEDDAAMPTVLVHAPGRVPPMMRGAQGNSRYVAEAVEVWRHYRARFRTEQALAVFTRHLRAFCGTRTTYVFDLDQAGEFFYIAFDTAAWREEMGLGEDYAGTAEDSFAEMRDYLNRNVWGLQLEHKVRREVKVTDLADPHMPLEWTQEEDWQCHDSVWGLYGDDRARALEVAREHFDIDTPQEATA